MSQLLVTLLISILIKSSLGWWDAGHLITAQIAKDELIKKSPQLYKYIEDLTLFGGNQYQVIVNNFVASGSWADDIKSKGMNTYNNWHFVDQPFNVDGQSTNHKTPSESNLILALNKIEGILLDKQTFGKLTNEKSEMIKLLIHLMSDLHQPLHAADLVNSTLIKGDRGGNLFNIIDDISGNRHKNLHAFWDSGAGLLPSFPRTRPYTNQALEEIQKTSNQITKEFPRSSLLKELDSYNYSQIAKETYFSAKLHTYGPLLSEARQTVRMTKEYQLKTYEVTRFQLALSGYRLADKLTKIFEPQLRMQRAPVPKKTIQ